MYRCCVLDDEKYAADIIVSFIEKVPWLTVVESSGNVFLAIDRINRGEIDLLFLDVQMPDLNGLDVLERIGNRCKVILTTAYPDYALDGFEFDVIDYLMKPVGFDRFLRAVEKVQRLDILPLTEAEEQPATFLMVKGDRKHKYHKVFLDDIYYIESLRNYVKFVTEKGNVISYNSLALLSESLPHPPFFRVHRSFIISTRHLRVVEGNTVNIAGTLVPVGESYKKVFFNYLESGGIS